MTRTFLPHFVLFATLATAADAQIPDPPAPSLAEEITVTGARLPTPIGEETRYVEVITREAIERHGVRGIPELLQLVPGLDVARRGPYGVQADLRVRGSSFEDVLVLVDGVPMNSAQTGHHNLDLPIPIAAIERVEVLYGPGAALYGANAAGAVVHIRTRTPEGSDGRVEAFAGEHGLAGARGEVAGPLVGSRHRVTLERTESQGYRPGTEFDQSVAAYRGRFGAVDLFAGASSRDFGAYRFYSARFPNEREETDAAFAGASWADALGPGELRVRGAWRRHEDLFVLERTNPGLLTNLHENRAADLEASWSLELPRARLETGGGWVRESLRSSNLGDHDRDRVGTFVSIATSGAPWRLHGALHADLVDGDWEVHPSLSASVPVGAGRLRGSVGTAYRLPSYTELYYRDPTSAGSPDLDPERSTTFELGYDRAVGTSRLATTVFERRGRDLIDFVLAPGAELFRARNLREVTTRGAEISAGWRLDGLALTAGYTYLDAQGDEPEGISRYVFDYLRHRALLRAESRGSGRFGWASTVSYNARRDQDAYWRLDGRLSWRLSPRPLEIYVEGSNLTDASYRETGGVEMPGRWLSGGLSWSW